MDWGHVLMGLLLALACWHLRGPLFCRLGFHARPRFSSPVRWVCRRCPTIHGPRMPTAHPLPATARRRS